jgi:hypothetical protein
VEEAEDEPLFCERAAGIDIGKQMIMVTIRIPSETRRGGRQQETREFGTTRRQLLALADWLRAWGVERAGMESTSDYWKPVYFLLEREGFDCVLYQASQVKVLPGRPKTDKLDSAWLAKVTERGALAGSFVPPEDIRRLRTHTRYRRRLIQARTAEKQRAEKLLEDAHLKLSSVISDIHGVSGRAMLEAVIAGERNPRVLAEMARGRMRRKTAALTVMLLIIAIVGTTVAPWQLFFQQSYVVDKRITPRFMRYEKTDLVIGIIIVIVGASAMMAFCAATFASHPEFGNFTDAGGTAVGLGKYVSHTAGILFAIALLDASIIGAAAVGLATSYATADVLSLRHSLHRPVTKAKGFYLCYAGLMAVAAALVLIPSVPLGTLTSGVQTLAGVLLPSATVFLLLLCNDKAVLGPWVNGRKTNVFTSIVIWILVLLSVILTASVLFPSISSGVILAVLGGGAALGVLIGGYLLARSRRQARRDRANADELPGIDPDAAAATAHAGRALDHASWRMPPLAELPAPVLSAQRKVGLIVLRGYLLVAVALVIVKIVQVSLGH